MTYATETSSPARWSARHLRALEVSLDCMCWLVAVLLAAVIGVEEPSTRIHPGHLAWLVPIVLVAQVTCGLGTGLYRGAHRLNTIKSIGMLGRSTGLVASWLVVTERWMLSAPVSLPVTVGSGVVAMILMMGVRYVWRRRERSSVLVLDRIGSIEGIEVGRRKRAFDLVIGLPLAVVALPAIAVAAIVSAISLRAWPFFAQERLGHQGTIRFVKIRTLPPTAPRYGLKTDEAVVATSRLLSAMRRAHIDELPQLFLVVTGRMTLVGPRPRMPDAHEPVPAAYHARRITVPQGCTGLWQISADRGGLPHEYPEYDFFYITHWTVRLDVWVLWRTFRKLSHLGGPIDLSSIPQWVLGGRAIAADIVVGPAPGEVAVHDHDSLDDRHRDNEHNDGHELTV